MPKNGCFFVKRYAVREAKLGRNAVGKGGVALTVMDCGINFISFIIPDQVYCNKSQKIINILFKTVILQQKSMSPYPFTKTWDCLALSLHVNVSVYVKREYM